MCDEKPSYLLELAGERKGAKQSTLGSEKNTLVEETSLSLYCQTPAIRAKRLRKKATRERRELFGLHGRILHGGRKDQVAPLRDGCLSSSWHVNNRAAGKRTLEVANKNI